MVSLTRNPIAEDTYSDTPLPIVILYKRNREIGRLPFTEIPGDIEKWVLRNVNGDKIKSIGYEELNKLVNSKNSPLSLIFVGDNEAHLEQYEIFKHLSSEEVEIEFYDAGKNWTLAIELGISYPGFVLVKPFTPYITQFKGDMREFAEVQKFVKLNSIKNAFVFGEGPLPSFDSEIPFIFLFGSEDIHNFGNVKTIFTAVGNKYGDNSKFIIVDFTNDLHPLIAQEFGVMNETHGIFIYGYTRSPICNAVELFKMDMPESLTDSYLFKEFSNQLIKFQKNFIDGSIKPFERSEAESNNPFKLTRNQLYVSVFHLQKIFVMIFLKNFNPY